MLLLIALALVVAVTVERLDLRGSSVANEDQGIAARVLELRRIEASREAITSAYADIALVYVERMSNVIMFAPAINDPAGLAEQRIAATLGEREIVLQSAVSVETVAEIADGVHKFRAVVSFETESSQQALEALYALGNPRHGLAWERLTVTADADLRRIIIDGVIGGLVIESAE